MRLWRCCSRRARISLEGGAQWSVQGALTPRHRPNRHGRYHRAPGGLVTGTLSIPEVPQGWHRSNRAKIIVDPMVNKNLTACADIVTPPLEIVRALRFGRR